MKLKNITDVKQPILKITKEEIISIEGFGDLSEEETAALADFIYSISIVLYKTNENGES